MIYSVIRLHICLRACAWRLRKLWLWSTACRLALQSHIGSDMSEWGATRAGQTCHQHRVPRYCLNLDPGLSDQGEGKLSATCRPTSAQALVAAARTGRFRLNRIFCLLSASVRCIQRPAPGLSAEGNLVSLCLISHVESCKPIPNQFGLRRTSRFRALGPTQQN